MKKTLIFIIGFILILSLLGCKKNVDEPKINDKLDEASYLTVLDKLWEKYIVATYINDMFEFDEIDEVIILGTSRYIYNYVGEFYSIMYERYTYDLEMFVKFTDDSKRPVQSYSFKLTHSIKKYTDEVEYYGSLEDVFDRIDLEEIIKTRKLDFQTAKESIDDIYNDGMIEGSIHQSRNIERRFQYDELLEYIPNIIEVVEQDSIIYTINSDNVAAVASFYSPNDSRVANITAEINGYLVKKINDYAFNYARLSSIVIPSGIEEIGIYAFNQASSRNLVIPASVKIIGDGSFYRFIGKVTFEEGSQLEIIGEFAFAESRIINIVLPASLKEIGNFAFSDIEYLQSIDVALENEHFCSKDGVLYNKTLTTLIKYPIRKEMDNFEVLASIELIEDFAFKKSKYLKSITFEEDSQLIKIGDSAFSYSSIENIIIPASVIEIGSHGFSYTSNLSEVSFEEGSRLKNIGENAFCDSKITEFIIPEGVIEIGDNAFKGTLIEHIIIPKNVEKIGLKSFSAINTLNSIEVDKDNMSYKSIDGVLYNIDTTVLLTLPLGKKVTSFEILASVKIIEDYMFYGQSTLTTITFEENSQLERIKEFAFVDTSITDIIIPASVKYIEKSIFKFVSTLQTVTFEEDSQLKSIDEYAFAETSIATINIPSSVQEISNTSFIGIKTLSNITVDEHSMDFKSIDGVLFNKALTVLIKYPEGKVNTSYLVPASVEHIEDRSFNGAGALSSIIFEENSQLKIIGHSAFRGTSINEIIIPASVEEIGPYSFYSIEQLISVIFEENSSLKKIGFIAFQDTSITEIIIPISVIEIGYRAFETKTLINAFVEAKEKPEEWANNWILQSVVVEWNYDQSN
jgi:hypothetical protein